ncbi:RNA polymerase sigma factor [Anaerobacillus isosaccharinicus]|uniref:RNA polymerase sigma factor n=1 Tax=Anaerobacillus isosaccharinicus TaxID=1532552 RepID=A0A1S2LGP1_9BACI|nr:RNA polymerase sigma factor [Anaerobacillus isosaccharinicus]MBA5586538.1 RNA polymerase sigma factor [Anaerobacillus isosaccharinicus]QOY35222.1 RNA polymerase sigma factor [Anaerobacillus isosaccharinicus]
MNVSKMRELLNEKLKVVYFYLLKMGAIKEDAEDIIQDTAYKFLLYIDSIKIENVDGWLFRVAVNQYYDLTKKNSRRKKILLHFNYKNLFEEITPESVMLRKELSVEIDEVLQQLKPKYRELLILKYSTGLTLKEIAEVYTMKEGSVKTVMARARAEFVEVYRRYEDGR